jgi:hypothetical protein
MNDPSEQLLAAHVEHELSRLSEAGTSQLIDSEVAALFEWLADVNLNDVVTRAQVTGVIERYVIDLKVSGAITELSGEMSQRVFASNWSERTRLDEVLRPESYAAFAEKLGALEGLWREFIHVVVEGPAFRALVSRVVQGEIMALLFRRGPSDPAATDAPLRDLWPQLLDKIKPSIDRRLETFVTAYFEAHAEQLAARSEQRLVAVLTPESLRSLADEFWEAVAPMRLSEAFAYIGAHDLEDFVVLGYEFWLKYRKTRYFREISRELVDLFFDKYGDDSLSSLLEEFGVTATMVSLELHTFVAPLLAHATASGFLRQRIRARLEPFYRSAAVASILAR